MGTHQWHLAISYQTAHSTSIRRLPAHAASALTIHRREIQALWSHNRDTGSYDTLYQVERSSSDVVICWTVTGTHVVPDRQLYHGHTPITSCMALIQLLYLTYNCSMESHTSPSVDLSPIPHLSPCVKIRSFFSFWTACDTPSIEINTTEQQVARHNQPNIIYTHNR